MGRRGPRAVPRGPKSSRFVGVKKRGGCISVDMRCGRRWEVSGFATEELAGLAHDFFRLLQDEPGYDLLGAKKLNFPQERKFLIRFSEQNGMEKFRVVAEEEEKNWGDGKKKDFMELVKVALCQIKLGNTVRAGDSKEDAEAASAQTDFVHGSNDDTSHIRISGGEENTDWDMEKVFPSRDEQPYSYKWFHSRESESAIHSRIVELEALLSAVTEENKSLKAENERLRQQLAVRVEGHHHGQSTTDAPVDGQTQSGDAGGTNTGTVNTLLEGDQSNSKADSASDFSFPFPTSSDSVYRELESLPNSCCTSNQTAYPWANDLDTHGLIDSNSEHFPSQENDCVVAESAWVHPDLLN